MINQVYPKDWDLTRAGDKAARSVPNAKRALTELAEKFQMETFDFEEWPMLALNIMFVHHYKFCPTDKAMRVAFQELDAEWKQKHTG